jgi:prepilin-type N-terminal cleavage/methylation domain-containing protein
MIHRRGFTLIEIMVVMAIIGVITAVTIVSFGSGKERKAVEGQARKVAAAIREMQNYALTGKQVGSNVPCKFGPGSAMSGDIIVPLRYSYRTGTSCSAGMSASTDIPGMTMSLENGVTFASDSNEFFFTVPRGELVDFMGVPISTTVNIQLSKGSTTYYSVCVYPGGQVKDVAGATCP